MNCINISSSNQITMNSVNNYTESDDIADSNKELVKSSQPEYLDAEKEKTNYKDFGYINCDGIIAQSRKYVDNLESGYFNKIRFECLLCPYVTEQYINIRKHIACHNRFLCNYCGNSFSRKEGLKTHMNRHTEEKPFACDLCPLKFSHRYSRYIHRKSH